ncbi:YagK/YfjJ domain-containing protein [Escherichia coli]
MTYKYNPFWQQRIRETVRHALNVHSRLTALRVDLRFPDVPAATDAAVISRFINALKARIDAYQKRKHREGKRVHPTTLHYVWARSLGSAKVKTLSPDAAGQPGYLVSCRRLPRSGITGRDD